MKTVKISEETYKLAKELAKMLGKDGRAVSVSAAIVYAIKNTFEEEKRYLFRK